MWYKMKNIIQAIFVFLFSGTLIFSQTSPNKIYGELYINTINFPSNSVDNKKEI